MEGTIEFRIPYGTVVKANGVAVTLRDSPMAETNPASIPLFFGYTLAGADPVAMVDPDPTCGVRCAQGECTQAECKYPQRGNSPDVFPITFDVKSSLFRPKPIRNAIRERLINEAILGGATRESAERALADIESERPLIDLLLSVDWLKVVALIVKLAALL